MKPSVVGASLVFTALAMGAPARADIPAGYTGTPYKGTAWPIPGRIDFENFDLGGYNVAFKTDHHTLGGPIGCSGGDYRQDPDVPTLCKTNQGTEVDKLADGTLYPSAANPVSYYIGAVRPGDWVQLTVNVKAAGTYKLSSTWAAGHNEIDVSFWFNGVEKLKYQTAGANDYHKWFPANQFGEVQLEAGVQVLKFVANKEHVNYDYVQFSLVTPGGLDDGSGAGGGGAGGAGSAGAAGSSTAGSGGASGAATAGADAGGASAAGAATAGSSAAGASAAGAPTSTAGAPSVPSLPSGASDESSCTIGTLAPSSSSALHSLMIAAVASALMLARRQRTRR